MVLIATIEAQWLNNYGYDLNAAGVVGGYYPANSIFTAYTGHPFRTAPYYGLVHPGWPTNAYYPVASLASYDITGNQVGGYGQVQDTAEVAQAKAAHFAAHAAAKAHLMKPVVTAVADVIASPTATEASVVIPISRKKRQIHPLSYTSPFVYGFPSPLAYNHFAAHPGHSYGAPFGYHFAHPYGNQFYPVVSNAAAPVVGSPDATTNTVSTVTDIAPAVIKTA